MIATLMTADIAAIGGRVLKFFVRTDRGVAKLVKASDFDSDIRRFESFFPYQYSGSSRASGSLQE